MFPIGEGFNFVFCGIATVAASVGYAFTRKQNSMVTPFATAFPSPREKMNGDVATSSASSSAPSLVSSSSPVLSEKAPESHSIVSAGGSSLKRKVPHDGFDEHTPDEGYPNNLRNIYPNKRCRTATPSSDDGDKEHVYDVGPCCSSDELSTPTVVKSSFQPSAPITLLPSEVSSVPRQGSPAPSAHSLEVEMNAAVPSGEGSGRWVEEDVLRGINSPAVEPPRTPSPVPVLQEPIDLPALPLAPEPQGKDVTPPSAVVHAAVSTPNPSTQPSALDKSPPVSTPFPSPGFAAFAGSTSPFASVKKTSHKKFRASLWNVESNDAVASSESTSRNDLGSAFGDAQVESKVQKGDDIDSHVIAAATPTTAAVKPSVTRATGEEEEDVEQEIKSVKLFVKRGNKPFASGMVGHLKLLSDRKTLAERLLFRREPLWQVSMNVRVSPTTRCVYDPEESVIRLTLKEFVAPSSGSSLGPQASELVVYALKPGRACSKQDFKDFAEALLKNAHFQKSAAKE